MGWPYRTFVRPTLRLQDSEKAHARALRGLRLTSRMLAPFCRSPSIPSEHFGLQFDNPVGLAAGMDKQAECIAQWPRLGFGWTEVGGVTMLGQPGNPKPRMFRADAEQALVNRMGFNNHGSEAMAARLASAKPRTTPLAINLGKSKATPNEEAHIDYATSLARIQDYADLFVVNVSSPNTPNLRELQAGSELERILIACNEANTTNRPLLVKITGDLADEQILAVADTAKAQGCAGIIATNTTLARPEPANARSARALTEIGGMSGKPLRTRSNEVCSLLYDHCGEDMTIVGVGGIHDAESAWERIGAGASLIQFYSAFVFEGPGLARAINRGIAKRLKAGGYASLTEAVGHAHRS